MCVLAQVLLKKKEEKKKECEKIWMTGCLTWPTLSCCVTTSTRLTVCLPAQPSVCEAFWILLFQCLVSHYTDTHFYILSLTLNFLL